MSDEVVRVYIEEDNSNVIVTPIKDEPDKIIINEGTAGPRGPAGIPGPRGPGGGGGLDIEDVSYVHMQATPQAEWMIVHPLSYYPAIVVVDSAGTEQIGDVRYASQQLVYVTFGGAFSGTAYLS